MRIQDTGHTGKTGKEEAARIKSRGRTVNALNAFVDPEGSRCQKALSGMVSPPRSRTGGSVSQSKKERKEEEKKAE